jgi:hypothetical protein
MKGWYTKRAKAMLAHKFKSHIKPQYYQSRAFYNGTGLYGISMHQPPRYVYCRVDRQRILKLNRLLYIGQQLSDEEVEAIGNRWADEFKAEMFEKQADECLKLSKRFSSIDEMIKELNRE